MLLVAVLLIGVDVKGAQRWLDLPGFPRFQPSELMKLALPAMVAWWLTRQKLPPKVSQLIIAAVLIVLPVTLIAKQPDLGTSYHYCRIWFSYFFSWNFLATFAMLGGLGVASLPVLWMVMRDYQRTRVMTLLDPQSDPRGRLEHHSGNDSAWFWRSCSVKVMLLERRRNSNFYQSLIQILLSLLLVRKWDSWG